MVQQKIIQMTGRDTLFSEVWCRNDLLNRATAVRSNRKYFSRNAECNFFIFFMSNFYVLYNFLPIFVGKMGNIGSTSCPFCRLLVLTL